MKNQLNYLKCTSLLFILVTLISCNKNNEPEEPPFNVLADVFYKNIMLDGEKQTARAYYVYGDRAIASAVAATPDGQLVELDQSSNQRFIRFYEPDISEFQKDYPTEGAFEFELKSWDEITRRSSDELEIVDLDFPVIEDFIYHEEDNAYDISWTEVTDGEGYKLMLLDEQSDTLYTGELLSPETLSSSLIEGELGTWTGSVIVGNMHTLLVLVYNFDKEAEVTTKHLHVQEVSITEHEFIWGDL